MKLPDRTTRGIPARKWMDEMVVVVVAPTPTPPPTPTAIPTPPTPTPTVIPTPPAPAQWKFRGNDASWVTVAPEVQQALEDAWNYGRATVYYNVVGQWQYKATINFANGTAQQQNLTHCAHTVRELLRETATN